MKRKLKNPGNRYRLVGYSAGPRASGDNMVYSLRFLHNPVVAGFIIMARSACLA